VDYVKVSLHGSILPSNGFVPHEQFTPPQGFLKLAMPLQQNVCRNPNLGLAPKAKRLQGCGPRGSSGVTSHIPGSVRKCEGVNPHLLRQLPLWEMESRWTFEISESNFKGQNWMACGILYIIWKFLKRKCLKWARIIHLDI
jgi:hypothetical protein